MITMSRAEYDNTIDAARAEANDEGYDQGYSDGYEQAGGDDWDDGYARGVEDTMSKHGIRSQQ
ncbi:hypothetical protein OG474_29950 [Kribbella sp. NBC_01505]|uniref:hypothetical protein n=1 Tax=Kribbella sp. NBC_01505 TaxID=2903580 RepID=UPI003870BEF8